MSHSNDPKYGLPAKHPNAPDPVLRGYDPASLHAILNRHCSLAIWDRDPPAVPYDYEGALVPEGVDDIDDIVPSSDLALHAAVLLGAAGYDTTTAVALAREVESLADVLQQMTATNNVRLRLEVVETDACRRFHADMVTLRLIVTLHGPGSQWIRTDAPDVIENIPTGAVAIFKGRLLCDEPVILHRSPPIAGTGQVRLVLIMDPV